MRSLQTTRGRELGGIPLIATFVERRIQPLGARNHPMYLYSGRKDVTRVSPEILGPSDIRAIMCKLTSLAEKSDISFKTPVTPFSLQHPRPVVSV